jgi:hypothetical protein
MEAIVVVVNVPPAQPFEIICSLKDPGATHTGSVASWIVELAPREAKPCNRKFRRGSKMWSGSEARPRPSDQAKPQPASVAYEDMKVLDHR